jgi:hypothetical protein
MFNGNEKFQELYTSVEISVGLVSQADLRHLLQFIVKCDSQVRQTWLYLTVYLTVKCNRKL